MKPFNERLKIAINDESVNAFSKRCDISEGTLRTYLSGTSLPGLDKLVAISDATQVKIEWLATGTGPMMEDDRETFNIPLLAVIIEALEEHEMNVGKKLTPKEKADFISTAYDMCIDDEAASSQTKDNILKSMKIFSDFFNYIDSLFKTKKGLERARKILTREFRISLSKDEAEWEVEKFICSRILRAHYEMGTMKFPVTDKDGTIRLIDSKDLETKKDTKNHKP